MIDTARAAVGRRRFLLGAGASLLARQAAALLPDESLLVAASGLDPASIGFLVVDAQDGREISAHNPDALFIPASVAKLPHLLATVGVLGPHYRFRTRLVVDGPLPGRVNQQRLVLVGGGDPVLDADKLVELARALARSGPQRYAIFGYDDSLLVAVPRIVADQPEAAAFNPGIGALSVNFNRVLASWRRGRDGAPAIAVASVAAHTRVPVDWIALQPRPGEPNASHRTVRGREEWSFALDPQPAGSVYLPVRNPGYNAAMTFRTLARTAGVTLPLPQRVTAAADAREVAAVESDPLVDIARAVLRYSNNPATEMLGLAASRALAGRALDLAASARALTDWLKARTPGPGGGDWAGLRFANHSGLSGESRASPRQLAAIVRAARAGAYAPADLAALLPQVAARAQADSDAEIDAKSGSMWFASGLAGLSHTRNGRPVAFAAFAVDWQQRAALDAMVGPRPAEGPDGARAWTLRARGLINDLARQWARA